ncbi:MAG: hypothetical protein HOG49_13115 [Candidatus Scalindua sp.]|jgi:hypothetical protein|nr:hypothetical protein [Candidatus Scalindua sp.]
MVRKECKKCVFDEKSCVLCVFVSEKSIYGTQKPLKFYSAEFHENALQRVKELEIPLTEKDL